MHTKFHSPLFAASLVLAGAPALLAQAPVPAVPVIGSSNPVSAEPPVTRPSTTPCVVPLFTGQQFINYDDKHYTFTPPADCKGPWARVVFTADFNVSAGRQFDRTAKFFLGGANIYFGTTAEPRAALSPSWHVERDITDLSALLGSTQPVVASLGNFYGTSGGVNYNGIITGSARLELYPADAQNPAPAEPDAVLPLNAAGQTTALHTTDERLTGSFAKLPGNVERAYLQVFAQSQASDEFWYTCSPNSVAAQLDGNCGNTGFRETDVYVDGAPAGIAPVFPWIYTGGIDPALWEPITGVQTLNFKPYLVDLTPFAGVLSDGQAHTVSVGVYNANNEFDVAGSLLLYLDHGGQRVTGAVTANTLGAAPAPYVYGVAPVDASKTTHGKTFVGSFRQFQISGYVNTSHGKVATTIDETVAFGNYQSIDFNDVLYDQNIDQLTTAYTNTMQESTAGVKDTKATTLYPLTFAYNSTNNADGSGSLYTHSYQQDFEYTENLLNGASTYTGGSQEVVDSTDQYTLAAGGKLASRSIGSNATYKARDTQGHCYSRALTSKDEKLTAVVDGSDCGGVNKP